jgi:hypothetical protein
MRLALVIVAAATLAGCFSPDQPACAFRCGDSAPVCPDNYFCGTDNYCHLNGHNEACPFPDAGVPDLPVFMPDLLMPDGGAADMATPDMAVSVPDLAMPDLSMPDLAPPADLSTPDDLSSTD